MKKIHKSKGKDFGCISYKNGVKVISDEFGFNNMFEQLGTEYDIDLDGKFIKGNYKTYQGDKDFYVCVWKSVLVIFEENKRIGYVKGTNYEGIESFERFRFKIEIKGIELDIKRIGKVQYRLRFLYKGDEYVTVYGYGIEDSKLS